MGLIATNILTGLITASACVLVMMFWRANWKRVFSGHAETHDWLICGIWISFFGSLCDNILWCLIWRSRELGLSTEEWWFSVGPAGNIFFRHLIKCCAVGCHLMALIKSGAVPEGEVLLSVAFMLCIAVMLFLVLVCM